MSPDFLIMVIYRVFTLIIQITVCPLLINIIFLHTQDDRLSNTSFYLNFIFTVRVRKEFY